MRLFVDEYRRGEVLKRVYIVHMNVGPLERLQLHRVADDRVLTTLACSNDHERDLRRLGRAAEKRGYVVEEEVREEDRRGPDWR